MCIFSCFTLKIAFCSRVNSGAAGKWLQLEISKCLMYADDTVMYASDASATRVRKLLQKDLHNVERWSTANRLSLNVKKT